MEHKGYKCAKCGATGSSKDIGSRSFFPSNMMAALCTNLFTVQTVREVPTSCAGNPMPDLAKFNVTISFSVYECSLKNANLPVAPDEAEIWMVNAIRELEERTVREWLCDHKYEEVV